MIPIMLNPINVYNIITTGFCSSPVLGNTDKSDSVFEFSCALLSCKLSFLLLLLLLLLIVLLLLLSIMVSFVAPLLEASISGPAAEPEKFLKAIEVSPNFAFSFTLKVMVAILCAVLTTLASFVLDVINPS